MFSPILVLYLFVALSKATYAENSHIVLSSRYYKKAFIFSLLTSLPSCQQRYNKINREENNITAESTFSKTSHQVPKNYTLYSPPWPHGRNCIRSMNVCQAFGSEYSSGSKSCETFTPNILFSAMVPLTLIYHNKL